MWYITTVSDNSVSTSCNNLKDVGRCSMVSLNKSLCYIFKFFSVRLFVGSALSFGFSIPDCIHYIYFPILILEIEPVFPLWMFSAKQGHYWYHFYNVFGMTRPWLGIEPGTSRTRSQHYTTRLSRRRYITLNTSYNG